MSASEQGHYIRLGDRAEGQASVNLWWDQKNPDSIHLTTTDDRFTDEEGMKAGLRVVFSANPRSADYNPGNFNRCARALAAAGKPAPAEAPLARRQLKERPEVIAKLAGGDALPQVPGAAHPKAFGWDACPACKAVVLTREGHDCG